MALHSEAPDAKRIAFVSMGTGVYKWPMALAADIAAKALLMSTFEETLMCVMDGKTRLIYQDAFDRYCHWKRGLFREAVLGFGGGGGNYSAFVLTPSEPPELRSRVVSPLRGSAEPAPRLHPKINGQ